MAITCHTAHIIIITNIITTINNKMRQPFIIMLVGLMTLTGIVHLQVHLYRLNQGHWFYYSLSPQRGVTRSVAEVVVQHPTATTKRPSLNGTNSTLFDSQSLVSPTPNSTQKQSRVAYLITVDDKSPRTVRSKTLLTELGFIVRLEFAPIMEDKVLSNKMAQLAIHRKIIADEARQWGYIFEDDIVLVGKSRGNSDDKIDFSVEHDLTSDHGMESVHPYFVFLGICGPNENQKNLYCGRCAHAYGISRQGAKMLLEFDESYTGPEHRYMDVVTDAWCESQGGFPVSHIDHISNQFSDHAGAFIQDRGTFKSLISL
jgi:hypothetical protein